MEKNMESKTNFIRGFKKFKSVIYAILAALLYGISSPISKLLLAEIPF